MEKRDSLRRRKKCRHHRTEIKEVTFKNGTHHLKRTCSDCGKYLGWAPHPGALEKGYETRQQIIALLEVPGALADSDNRWFKKLAKKNTYPEWIRARVRGEYLSLETRCHG